jgi:curved DNA-binding protein CbpA
MPLPDLTPTATGKLSKTPLPHLLVYMLDHQLDGSLVLKASDASEHVVHFSRGSASKVRIAYDSAYLGTVLQELGFIDMETLESSRETLLQQGGLHGQLLIAAGKLDKAMLAAALREQVTRRMVKLFQQLDNDTMYEFYGGLNLLDDFGGPELTPVDPLRVLCLGVRARPDFQHIDPMLARLGTGPLVFRPSAADVGRFGFSAGELSALDVLRARPSSLPDILASGLMPEPELKVLVYLLLITRNVELAQRAPAQPAPEQPAPAQAAAPAAAPDEPVKKPAAIARVRLKSVQFAGVAHEVNAAAGNPEPAPDSPRSAAAPPPPAAQPPQAAAAPPPRPAVPPPPAVSNDPKLAQWRETIKARAQSIESENFFTVLGVNENAPPDALQSAYFALAKLWHPDRLPAELADVKELAAKCFGRMSEAFQTLSDGERRLSYQAMLKQNLVSTEEQAKVQQVIEAAIDFQKAEVFLKKRDLEQAEYFSRRAFQGDPEQAEYAVLAAWLMVLTREKLPNPDYSEPLRMLTAAIDREPRLEKGYFYRAQVLQRQNRMEQAIRDFRKSMELNPRNIESAREVRLWEMRGGSKGAEAEAKAKDGKSGGGLLGKLFKR